MSGTTLESQLAQPAREQVVAVRSPHVDRAGRIEVARRIDVRPAERRVALPLVCEPGRLIFGVTSVFASPTFARWLTSLSESMNLRPASAPPLIPKPRIAPAPRGPLREAEDLGFSLGAFAAWRLSRDVCLF